MSKLACLGDLIKLKATSDVALLFHAKDYEGAQIEERTNSFRGALCGRNTFAINALAFAYEVT